jgi:hypothetical protein
MNLKITIEFKHDYAGSEEILLDFVRQEITDDKFISKMIESIEINNDVFSCDYCGREYTTYKGERDCICKKELKQCY